jgi:hypothetical protein
MDSRCQLLSFLTTTHTHIFYNHNNGYRHLKRADVRSPMDCRKSDSSMLLKLGLDFGIYEHYDF